MHKGIAALITLLAPVLALAQQPDGVFHQTNFDDASEIGRWTTSSGTWQIQDGAFVNSATGATNIATVETYDPFDFPVIESDLGLDVYAIILNDRPNARVGVVFNFSDPGNYHELTFSPSGAVRSVTVRGGVVVGDFVKQGPAVGINKWFHINVRRVGTVDDVKVDGVPVASGSQILPDGKVGLVTHNTRARFDDFSVKSFGLLTDPYRDTFDQGQLRGWTNLRPNGDGWTASGGDLESLAIGANDIIITPLVDLFLFNFSPNARRYTIKTQVINRYSNSGNLVGVVFYRDAQHYEEVVFSPKGVASLRRFVNGVRTTLATAPYVGGGSPSTPFEIEVGYRGNQGGPALSYVKTNGHLVFEDLPFDLEGGEIGLITHFTNARFKSFAAAPLLPAVRSNSDRWTVPAFLLLAYRYLASAGRRLEQLRHRQERHRRLSGLARSGRPGLPRARHQSLQQHGQPCRADVCLSCARQLLRGRLQPDGRRVLEQSAEGRHDEYRYGAVCRRWSTSTVRCEVGPA